jgi:hypothetical protein
MLLSHSIVVFFAGILGLAVFAHPAAAQDPQKPDLAEITEAWLASPHADRTAEAFTHWNEDGEVPGQCAVCHTATGMKDYLATDRSSVGVIDHAVSLGMVVECATCHGDTAQALQNVVFPSGAEADMGNSAICATCHQGRASSDSVTAAVAGTEDDAVSGDLGFINVHYKAAAATQMGDLARGGYQYEGKSYSGPFKHVPELDTCTSCHSPHSTKPVAVAVCATCHKDVTDYRTIRTAAVDVDGDGDTTEGIGLEIAALHEMLGDAIGLYAAEVAQAPVVYDSHAYPYFFADTDGDGAVSEGEAIYPNRYQSWTPRMLKASYNYQYVAKDTGAYAHNPHYAIQLLHDSLENLGEAVDVDMSGLARP